MVRSPFEILVEILITIVSNSIQTLTKIIQLLIEFFISLGVTAQSSLGGLITALVIGTLFFVFIWKFMFKTTTSLIKIILIYGVFIVFLFLITLILFSF